MQIQEHQYQGYRYHYLHFNNSNSLDKRDLVIFIGGAFQDIRASFKICKELSRDFDVLVADLPGSGSAQRLPYTYPFSFIADVVAELASELGYRNFHLIGCSYGSPIAYNVVQRYPERVKRVVLAGVMREIPQHIRAEIKNSVRLAEEDDMEGFNLLVRDIFFNLEMSGWITKQTYLREKFYQALQKMDQCMKEKYIDNTKRLLQTRLNPTPKVNAPILVLTGVYDNFTTPYECRRFATMCDNADYTFIDNADHFFHVEQPRVTIGLLSNFLLENDIYEIRGHGKISSDLEEKNLLENS